MNQDDLKFRTPHGPPVCLASDECLIEELMKRERLRIISVASVVPKVLIREEGYQAYMEKQQGEHIGQHLSSNGYTSTDISIQEACPGHPAQATFSMTILVLTPSKEGSH